MRRFVPSAAFLLLTTSYCDIDVLLFFLSLTVPLIGVRFFYTLSEVVVIMDENFVSGLYYDIRSLGVGMVKETVVLDLIDNVVCSLLNREESKEQLREEWKGIYDRLNGDG